MKTKSSGEIMKYHIESNSVQETLVIPLYGRKICTELYPNVFKDEKAVELIEKIDYDFSVLEKKSSGFAYRFGALRPYTPKKFKNLLIEKNKLWNKLSFGTKWNLRDLFRHKSRSFMTLIGLIGCMVLLVGALGMNDTATGRRKNA